MSEDTPDTKEESDDDSGPLIEEEVLAQLGGGKMAGKMGNPYRFPDESRSADSGR